MKGTLMKHFGYGLYAAVFLLLTAPGAVFGESAYDWMKKEPPAATTEADAAKKGSALTMQQYAMIRGGVFLPDQPAGMNTGKGVEAGYGIQPLKWLAAEASFGFIDTDDYDENLNNMHRTIQMVPITATVRAILPFRQFDVYALAGGGTYYTMLRYDNVNQEPGADTGDKFLFGYQYGGGVSLLLGSGSTAGVEVRQIVTSWNSMDISGTFVTAFFRYGL